MKNSIRVKMTLILTVSLTFLVILCWILNQVFFEKFYTNKKISLIEESYQKIHSLSEKSPDLSDPDIVNAIERIEVSDNINVYIITGETADNGISYLRFLYPIQMQMGDSNYGIFTFDKYRRITDTIGSYLFANNNSNGRTLYEQLKSSNAYNVYKYHDYEIDSYYLDLYGAINDSTFVFMRSNYENIHESLKISSSLLAIVGIAVILVGTVFMFIFSHRFTKPITELAQLSDKYFELDFNQKYLGNSKDEIGELGKSMNFLSDKLEKTITDLKNANLKLENDIADKEHIDEMRKEFLSNITHELKTPLALIQGYAEGLKENINDDEESRNFYCDVILDESHKMNNIVKKLLTLNEIEFGNYGLSLEKYDIAEQVRQIVSSIDILIRQNNINLIFDSPEPVYVWADPALIEEVLSNYLSNAINHIDGQRIIDIRFTKNSSDIVRVSVFNTGENIPEDKLSGIWDKFYKVDKARTHEYGGNGIGLSIVKAIMEQHKKKYGVINHSAGVEFWFELDTKIEE